MGTSAIVMFVIGALFLWGGVVVAVINYARAAARESDDS